MRKIWSNRSWMILFLFILILIAFNTSAVWRWMYPIYYPDQIKQSAERNQLDPYLIIAIIQTESKFLHEKTSKKGAVGLMQLMRDTGFWIVDKGGYPQNVKDNLENPAINIELGSWYLRYLIDLFDGNIVAAIAAYNAGQGTVDRWIQTGVWDGHESTLYLIPYGETRHYVQRVLYMYARYQEIYGDDYWVKQ